MRTWAFNLVVGIWGAWWGATFTDPVPGQLQVPGIESNRSRWESMNLEERQEVIERYRRWQSFNDARRSRLEDLHEYSKELAERLAAKLSQDETERLKQMPPRERFRRLRQRVQDYAKELEDRFLDRLPPEDIRFLERADAAARRHRIGEVLLREKRWLFERLQREISEVGQVGGENEDQWIDRVLTKRKERFLRDQRSWLDSLGVERKHRLRELSPRRFFLELRDLGFQRPPPVPLVPMDKRSPAQRPAFGKVPPFERIGQLRLEQRKALEEFAPERRPRERRRMLEDNVRAFLRDRAGMSPEAIRHILQLPPGLRDQRLLEVERDLRIGPPGETNDKK